MMIGSVLLLAAMVSSQGGAPPASVRAPSFQPTTSATARATVSIRIVSGVRFGQDHKANVAGATRRAASLADAAGQPRQAELLEFQ